MTSFEIVVNKYFFDNFKENIINQLFKKATIYYGHDKWVVKEFTTSWEMKDANFSYQNHQIHWLKENDPASHMKVMMWTELIKKES